MTSPTPNATPLDLDHSQRSELLRGAISCPVARTLEAGSAIDTRLANQALTGWWITAARELKEGRFDMLGSGIPGASLDAMFRPFVNV